jgi:hypothetical protein
MVYRFRVTYEDHEDMFRDIDIKASQTFTDFHNIIQQSIGFDNSKPASFYIADDYWRKEEEIPVVTTMEKKKKTSGRHKEQLQKKVIADYVNNPHQKFIYMFDPEVEWTFQVELIKILPEDGSDYPKCVKASGNVPKQYKEAIPPPLPDDDEDEHPNKKKKSGLDALIEEMEEKSITETNEEDIFSSEEELKRQTEENEEIFDGEEGESSFDFDMEEDDDNQ